MSFVIKNTDVYVYVLTYIHTSVPACRIRYLLSELSKASCNLISL